MSGPKHLDPHLRRRLRLQLGAATARHGRGREPGPDEALEVFFPWVADRSKAAGFGDDIEAFLRSVRKAR
jgi:hypothetical protein